MEISNRRTFPDERGSFLELVRRPDHGLEFVQANHSFSRAGVVRGLHYHRDQHDLWYVVRGRARIGLADLRGQAPQVETFELDERNDPTKPFALVAKLNVAVDHNDTQKAASTAKNGMDSDQHAQALNAADTVKAAELDPTLKPDAVEDTQAVIAARNPQSPA